MRFDISMQGRKLYIGDVSHNSWVSGFSLEHVELNKLTRVARFSLLCTHCIMGCNGSQTLSILSGKVSLTVNQSRRSPIIFPNIAHYIMQTLQTTGEN